MSRIFERIEQVQGEKRWGRVLDAGTGWASLKWLLTLDSESITAVTGSEKRRSRMAKDFQLRSHDRLLRGNWVEGDFLKGEVFETVLLDYLVGALDRFAPYFQARLFHRMKPHVGGRLYLVGLEPYPEPETGEEDGEWLQALVALRDSAILLSGDRPHREFPRWWVADQLKAAGFEIVHQESYPILYGESFVQAELDVAVSCLKKAPEPLRAALKSYEQELRRKLLERVRTKPLKWGSDYLLVAEPR